MRTVLGGVLVQSLSGQSLHGDACKGEPDLSIMPATILSLFGFMTQVTESLAALKHWSLEADEKGICWLCLHTNHPGANYLNSVVIAELGHVLEGIETSPPRAVIIYSDRESGFCAGSDLVEIEQVFAHKPMHQWVFAVHSVLRRLEALPCPTVTMLHGAVLGGGLELALACRYRIGANDSSLRFGFPEVLLGIHPAFGGTVRAPAKLGVLTAMDLLLSGQSIDGDVALRAGLVDKLVACKELRERACNLALLTPKVHRTPWSQQLLGSPGVRILTAKRLRAHVGRSFSEARYPAPFAVINAWKRHGACPRMGSYQTEALSLSELIKTPSSRNLVYVSALQSRLQKLGADNDFSPKRIHVLGCGAMGTQIAAWCAARGMQVSLQDLTRSVGTESIDRIAQLLQDQLSSANAQKIALGRVEVDLDGLALSDADLVIEAVTEDMTAKSDALRIVEARLGENTLLATCTSSLPLKDLASCLARPERLIGLHFFTPVFRVPLVEVVTDEQLSSAQKQKVYATVSRMGKLPLPVANVPGFFVNRLLAPYLIAALYAFEENIPLELIDRTVEQFGMPIGPAELIDMIGLDVTLTLVNNLRKEMNLKVPENLKLRVAAGQLGRKSGYGLYRWENGRAVKRRVNLRKVDPDLVDRLFLPLFNVAVQSWRKRIVSDAELVDAGLVFGAGFAPFRGGPMRYIQQCGPLRLKQRLDEFSERYGELYRADPGWEDFANAF